MRAGAGFAAGFALLAGLLLAVGPVAAAAAGPVAAAAAGPVAATAEPAPAEPAPIVDAEAAFKALAPDEQKLRLEAAGRMMIAADMEQQLRQSLKSTVGFLMPIFLKGNEGKQADVATIVTEEFLLQSNRMVPLLAEQVRRRYAEQFTATELDGLSDFYGSALGRKFTAVSPELQARLMRDGAPVGEAAAQAALPRIIDRLKAANLNVPTRS